jgi:hypothetical protein
LRKGVREVGPRGGLMTLEIQPRTVYGRTLLYPVNELARLFCELLSLKTLSLEHLEIIKKMGIEIKVSHPDITKGL